MKKSFIHIIILSLALSVALPAMADDNSTPALEKPKEEITTPPVKNGNQKIKKSDRWKLKRDNQEFKNKGPNGHDKNKKFKYKDLEQSNTYMYYGYGSGSGELPELDPAMFSWLSAFNVLAGLKQFSSDWKEDSMLNIQIGHNIPSGSAPAEDGKLPAFFWALDYSLAVKNLQDKYEDYATHELHLGVRQIWSKGEWDLYWGGGLALEYATVDTPDPSARFSGYDYGAGYWVGVGLENIYEMADYPKSLGLSLKYVDVDLRDWAVNGGGWYVGITVGMPVRGRRSLQSDHSI